MEPQEPVKQKEELIFMPLESQKEKKLCGNENS